VCVFVLSLVQKLGSPFIAQGVTIYSLIILGINYIKLDGSSESSKSVVDSSFIITMCHVSSVSLERSRLWSMAVPLGCCSMFYPLSCVYEGGGGDQRP
jgi:hypothetical protein